MRTSSLRGLGAMPNVFALECCIDELAERAGQDPVAYRLSITADPRARAVIEKVAAMAKWKPGAPAAPAAAAALRFARYKNLAAYSAVVVELSVDEDDPIASRLVRDRCRPGGQSGRRDQPARRRHLQSASWVLKEQVRFDNGIASFDWETYPVLKFSEVPEIDVELINTEGRGAARRRRGHGGPTAAAIGNAVSHALGARIRDLPLTRERIMAALLKE